MITQLPRQQDETRSHERSGWLRVLWHRVHAGLQDMSYASRRVVEIQAPWITDHQSR
jgi:hypothetical protein